MERQKEEDLSGKVAIVTGGQHRARGQAGREDDFDERPARILAYFAACENPLEYTGRVFFAERKLAALGLSTGG
jgi:hypothetical protein